MQQYARTWLHRTANSHRKGRPRTPEAPQSRIVIPASFQPRNPLPVLKLRRVDIPHFFKNAPNIFSWCKGILGVHTHWNGWRGSSTAHHSNRGERVIELTLPKVSDRRRKSRRSVMLPRYPGTFWTSQRSHSSTWPRRDGREAVHTACTELRVVNPVL